MCTLTSSAALGVVLTAPGKRLPTPLKCVGWGWINPRWLQAGASCPLAVPAGCPAPRSQAHPVAGRRWSLVAPSSRCTGRGIKIHLEPRDGEIARTGDPDASGEERRGLRPHHLSRDAARLPAFLPCSLLAGWELSPAEEDGTETEAAARQGSLALSNMRRLSCLADLRGRISALGKIKGIFGSIPLNPPDRVRS